MVSRANFSNRLTCRSALELESKLELRPVGGAKVHCLPCPAKTEHMHLENDEENADLCEFRKSGRWIRRVPPIGTVCARRNAQFYQSRVPLAVTKTCAPGIQAGTTQRSISAHIRGFMHTYFTTTEQDAWAGRVPKAAFAVAAPLL